MKGCKYKETREDSCFVGSVSWNGCQICNYIRAERTSNLDLHFSIKTIYAPILHCCWASPVSQAYNDVSATFWCLKSAVSRLDGWSFRKGSPYGKKKILIEKLERRRVWHEYRGIGDERSQNLRWDWAWSSMLWRCSWILVSLYRAR